MLRGSLLPASLALLLSGPLAAQSIRGSVNDVLTGHPLPTVLVTAVDGDGVLRSATTTDARGAFVLRVPRGDTVVMRIHHFGYRQLESLPLALQRTQTLEVEVGMHPEPVAIEGVTALALPNANLERFLRRRQSGVGRYLGPEQIADLKPTSTVALLTWMGGGMLRPSHGGTRILANGRSAAVSPGLPHGSCVPAVFVDGFLLEDDRGSIPGLPNREPRATPFLNERGVPVDSYVRGGSVRGVEVYQSPGEAPPEFQRPFMPDCPLVVIWTNYGFESR